MHAEFLSVDVLDQSRMGKKRFSGNGNTLHKGLPPSSCARERSLGSYDEHRRWNTAAMVLVGGFMQIGLRSRQRKTPRSLLSAAFC
ncbi:hypothetical protein [Tardiphaga sp. 768_D3_N2_1]|uniref:hypothetical protein n=1 Tax=Tardiphaga sp. 768_D3_N2_1 TaxID=3240783 RepID=UPI003F8AC59A